MTAEWLDRSLFHTNHYYTLCTTPKIFKKALKHLKIKKKDRPNFMKTDIADATVHYFHTPDGNHAAIVCIRRDKTKTTPTVHALLVHEAVHIWQQTKRDLGENDPSTELDAYAVQNLALQLMCEYERQLQA